MRPILLAVAVAALASSQALAQVSGVQVKDGDVYVQSPTGPRRLPHDGGVSEAVLAPDRNLIAYLHDGPGAGSSSALNTLFLCGVPDKTCVLLVQGAEGNTTENNLAGMGTIRFSLQAGEGPDGVLTGSVFFMSEAGGANTASVHRVLLAGKTLRQVLNAPAPFVTYANSLEIVPSGRFAGALDIEVMHYTSHGACGAMTIFDPNTRKVLQEGPANDC